MENGDRPAGPVFYLVAAVVLVVDQLTKYWIASTMLRGESREVLGSFFRITYVHNDGAAFGLDLGGRWSFIVVTVLVASTARTKLRGADTGEALRETLRILGSTSSSELMALEVIWQPEGRGDVLSAEELITAYPNLQHL